MGSANWNRREFLKSSGLAAAGISSATDLRAKDQSVSIVLEEGDSATESQPVKWAASEFRETLVSKGIAVQIHSRIDQAPAGNFCFVFARERSQSYQPETCILSPRRINSRAVVMAGGSDVRGIVYAVTELADRVRFAQDPIAALAISTETVETTANRIRSIARCFESELEDKPWYHDRAMWTEYLGMLVTQRLNRFSMTFGLQYNYPMRVTDSYLYFTYPFLFSVPGYNVRVKDLPDSERDRNLETLQFIGEQTVKRGLQFQVGLWTHAYEMPAGSEPTYAIEGLSRENHAAYCRDALHRLLEAVPSISGITFRIHGESGIREGDYDFWKTVFQGVVKAQRSIEIDMHAKGMDQKMIDVALATGMPVNVSPKYWAEHMGLGYHQAAIRELEMPPHDSESKGLFSLSNGSRKFLRYGLGDLVKEGRRYGILHRIWPGTQRFLLWGDPAMAAAYGRTANLCGMDGVEWCEPLSFKGRMGSGIPGGRCAYADTSLNPKYDWQKFEYTYRVWGRLTYNPSASPEGWRRYLTNNFQGGAVAAETALANASRVLPLLTTAHDPSASNNTFWPEIYTNMPIVDAGRKQPYGDTPAPKVFANVSALDPQLFSRISDYTAELLSNERSAKYSPLEVADWLEDAGLMASRYWNEAEKRVGPAKRKPEFRRMAADVQIQSGIGRFFAKKIRSAVLWEIWRRTGDSTAGEEALKAYQTARDIWQEFATTAKPVYVADITYGYSPHLRGHWMDRLAAIDEDLFDMQQQLRSKIASPSSKDKSRIDALVQGVLSLQERPSIRVLHHPAASFRPGEPLPIDTSIEARKGRVVRLLYRHLNQAEPWNSTAMEWLDYRYRASVPAKYTQTPYPLQYYFELWEGSHAILYPGFEPNLANQPYFVVQSAVAPARV